MDVIDWQTKLRSRGSFSFTDSYGVDIQDGEDDVLVLASTVVIDMICHGDQRRT